MNQESRYLLEKAVELTKAAIESPTGNVACINHPEAAVEFLGAIHEKLVQLSKSDQ